MSGNPARPLPGLDLCGLDDVADPGAKSFRFRDDEALFAGVVVRRNGEIRGFVDSCPHAGWPLSMMDDRYFTRTGEHLLCAGHGALFRPDDGICVAGPCAGRALEPWPVRVRNRRIVTG